MDFNLALDFIRLFFKSQGNGDETCGVFMDAKEINKT